MAEFYLSTLMIKVCTALFRWLSKP